MYERIGSVNITELLEFYYSIEQLICWNHIGPSTNKKHSGIQHASTMPQDENAWFDALKHKSDEKSVNIINPFYKDSPFAKLVEQYKMYRSRLAWLDRLSCYGMHKDRTKRIHIPIITNENNKFLMIDSSENSHTFHLPVGGVYLVDTTMMHTFINTDADKARIHLMGVV